MKNGGDILGFTNSGWISCSMKICFKIETEWVQGRLLHGDDCSVSRRTHRNTTKSQALFHHSPTTPPPPLTQRSPPVFPTMTLFYPSTTHDSIRYTNSNHHQFEKVPSENYCSIQYSLMEKYIGVATGNQNEINAETTVSLSGNGSILSMKQNEDDLDFSDMEDEYMHDSCIMEYDDSREEFELSQFSQYANEYDNNLSVQSPEEEHQKQQPHGNISSERKPNQEEPELLEEDGDFYSCGGDSITAFALDDDNTKSSSKTRKLLFEGMMFQPIVSTATMGKNHPTQQQHQKRCSV